MANPQLRAEGVDQGATGSGAFTIDFSSWTFQANDILELTFTTDGWIPVMTTANGWQVAVASDGGTASVSTNGGVPGANDCAITTFWLRATGTTATAPVFQAPSVQSGTSWCLQPNSYSGCRTTGTPYHSITTAIVSTSTTAGATVTSVAASSTIAGCLFCPRIAAPVDDAAFNNWTMTGSALPSGTKAPDTGWHNGTGNACCFTGDEGGFAAATSNVTATTSFGTTAPKLAMVTLVMASIGEAATPLSWAPVIAAPPVRRSLAPAMMALAFAGPVLPPTTAAAPPLSWAPTFPDFAPRARAAVITGGAAAPTTAIPDPAAPALSWAPVFPDSVARPRAAPLASGAAAPPATLPSAAAPPLSWAPGFPDSTPRARAAQLASGMAAPPLVIPNPPAPPLSWAPGFPDAIPRARAAPIVGGAAAPSITIPDPNGPPSLGAMAFREKSNTTTPNTGSIVTLAVYPAWIGSNAYALINAVRVTNGGNTYELAQGGTSASSGGPTGTGAAITDGTCKWNFLAAGTGACDTQSSGSFLVASVARGKDSTSGTVPRDNKGNTYSLINKAFYAGFPESSAALYSGSTPASGGTGHTLTADYGLGADGGGDEITEVLVEVINGAVIKDHAEAEVSPNGSNVCTSPTVTTTNAAVIIAFWWLNGTVQADGFLHTAISGSGFTDQPLASGLMEIANGAGQVQMRTATRVVSAPGTYSATITTANSEGAIVHIVAIQATNAAAPIPLSWSPRFADSAPRARQPVNVGGAAAPVATLPDAPALSWSPSFPDRIPRRAAAPIVGGAQDLQVGPSLAAVPPLAWAPAFPDSAARARAAQLASGAAAPVATLPDPAPLSWAPTFPHSIRSRVQAPPGGLVAPVQAIPDPPAPPLAWAPAFPDRAPRARAAMITGGGAQPAAVLPDPIPSVASWTPILPTLQLRRSPAGPIEGGAGAPVATLPNPPAPALSWAPVFPAEQLRRPPAAPITGGAASPSAVLPSTPIIRTGFAALVAKMDPIVIKRLG